MPWAALARRNVPAPEVAALMRCDVGQAARRLDEARQQEAQEGVTPAQEAAVALLTHSGAARPDLGRRRWQEVVLGLRRMR